MVISFFITRKYKTIQKRYENSQYWRKKSSYPLNNMRIFNEIFRKDVTYDNIKSHKNQDLALSPEDTFLEKPEGEAGCQIDFTPSPPAV